MNFASNMLGTAKKLIDKFGNTLTLKKADSTDYNPATGQVETVVGVSIPIKGTFEVYSSEEIQGSIQQGDIKTLVYFDENITYTDKDVIIADTINYSIVNVQTIKAQDSEIILELQLRR